MRWPAWLLGAAYVDRLERERAAAEAEASEQRAELDVGEPEAETEVGRRTRRKELVFSAALVFGLSGAALLGGFSYAFHSVRRQHGDKFVVDAGAVRLAYRALALGTAYAVCGVSATVLVVGLVSAKLLGVRSPSQLRDRMTAGRPEFMRVRHSPPTAAGRSDFDSFADLFDYIQRQDKEPSAAEPSAKSE